MWKSSMKYPDCQGKQLEVEIVGGWLEVESCLWAQSLSLEAAAHVILDLELDGRKR